MKGTVKKGVSFFYPFYSEAVIPGILFGWPSIYNFLDFFLIQNGFRAPKLLDVLFLNPILYMFSRFPDWCFSNV